MDITQSSSRIINSFPPLNNITPFTRVDGWSFLEVLEGLRNYIVNTLIPEIEGNNKKIVDQLNAWFEQYQLDHAELIDDINTAKNGWQELFDQFMGDVVAQLEALNDQAVANLVNNEMSLLKQALNNKFVKKNELVINVKDFGAKGDGVTDDLAAIEAAIAYAPAGSTLLFPDGHYYTTAKARLDSGEGWTFITKPLNMLGQGNVTLEHFAFNVIGSTDLVKPFAAKGFPGDETISLSEANLERGDLIQILTACNMYSEDAGEFQMGSPNGISGVLPLARGCQTVPVVNAAGNSVTVGQRLLYNYDISIAGFANPLPGVGNAEWRKINPIKGMTVTNIRFLHKASGSAGTKNWNIRASQDFTFKDCTWDLQVAGGSTVVVTDSFNFTMDNCEGLHNFTATDGGGSGNNMILIGAGMSKVRILNSRFERGSQIIDVITNDIPQNPSSQNGRTKSELRSCNDILVQGNYFNGQIHSMTTHPLTDGVMFASNFVHDSGLGFHSRARNTSVIGNYITSYLQGVGISAFSHHTTVQGNVLYQMLAPNTKKHGWIGVQVSGMGSEVVTHNAIKNMNIRGNTIVARDNTYSCTGINFSHTKAILDAQPDAKKIGLSDVNVTDNILTDCTVTIGEFFAGIRVNDNTIRVTDANNGQALIYGQYNSAACQIVDNILTHANGRHIDMQGRVNSGTLQRPYADEHLIDRNQIVGTPNIAVVGSIRPNYNVGRGIQAGLTPGGGAIEPAQVISVPVTFERAFIGTPRIVVTGLSHGYTVTITGVSSTGFTAQFRGTLGNPTTSCNYLAFGDIL